MKKRISEGDSPAGFIGGGILLNAVTTAVLGVLDPGGRRTPWRDCLPNRELMRVLIDYDVVIGVMLAAAVAYRTTQGSLQGQKRVATTGCSWRDEARRPNINGTLRGDACRKRAGPRLSHAIAGRFLLSDRRPALLTVDQLRTSSTTPSTVVGARRGRVFGRLDTNFLSFSLVHSHRYLRVGVGHPSSRDRRLRSPGASRGSDLRRRTATTIVHYLDGHWRRVSSSFRDSSARPSSATGSFGSTARRKTRCDSITHPHCGLSGRRVRLPVHERHQRGRQA